MKKKEKPGCRTLFSRSRCLPCQVTAVPPEGAADDGSGAPLVDSWLPFGVGMWRANNIPIYEVCTSKILFHLASNTNLSICV